MLQRRRKTAVARELRRRATATEQKAWTMLRNRGIGGFKFRRQKVIRGFIADFYCAGLKLVLEIDGSIHELPAQRAYDHERDAVFQRLGLTVVRLANTDVRRSRLEAVVAEVLAAQERYPAVEGRGRAAPESPGRGNSP